MPENDIHFNMENDMGKSESVTVYLTPAEKDALERYSDDFGTAMSDLCGGWIWPQLKQAGYLPEGYYRPAGF